MKFSSFSDSIKVTSFHCGSELAFNKLYAKYYFLVYSVSLSIINSPEDSKEIVNDVFEKIWNGSYDDENKDSFKNLVCKIARNESIDFLRKKKQEVTLIDPDEEPSLESESTLLYQENLELIISESLDETELFVFLSHVEREQTFKEIGKIIGLSENATSSLYTRARKKLSNNPKIQVLKTE